MGFVSAKCTQCGANIEVDNSKETGICSHCGTAFVTEKVIKNYNITNNFNISNATINLNNVNIDNLLIRAQQFEEKKDIDKAIQYYEKILDIDATNKTALEKLNHLNMCVMQIEDYFLIDNKRITVTGLLNENISIGDIVSINKINFRIDNIECSGKLLDNASAGMYVGLLFNSSYVHNIKRGERIKMVSRKDKSQKKSNWFASLWSRK